MTYFECEFVIFNLQSHANYVSPDSIYYYAFASDNGILFNFNLESLKVEKTLYTGRAPVQGTIINWDYFSYDNHVGETDM